MVQCGCQPQCDSISDNSRFGDSGFISLASGRVLCRPRWNLVVSVQFGFYYAQYDCTVSGTIFPIGRLSICADRCDANVVWSYDFCRRQCYFGAEFYAGFDRHVDMFLDRIDSFVLVCEAEPDEIIK